MFFHCNVPQKPIEDMIFFAEENYIPTSMLLMIYTNVIFFLSCFTFLKETIHF